MKVRVLPFLSLPPYHYGLVGQKPNNQFKTIDVAGRDSNRPSL